MKINSTENETGAIARKPKGLFLTQRSPRPMLTTSQLCFNNAENCEKPILLPASRDGHFKARILTDDADIDKKAIGWTCDFVGSYHKYQATNRCFSEDGSLLPVSFEEIVAIWDSETWELKCTNEL